MPGYCPYRAAQRSPLAVALSRFGTLPGVGLTSSYSRSSRASLISWDPAGSLTGFVHVVVGDVGADVPLAIRAIRILPARM